MPPLAKREFGSGDCIVCQKQTQTFCSECPKKPAVHFCSIGHQELLWPVHSRLCKQSTFEWPDFTASELEAMDRVEASLGNSESDIIGESLFNSYMLLEMGIFEGDCRATFAAYRKGGDDAPHLHETTRGKLRHRLLQFELDRSLRDSRKSLSQIYAGLDPFQLSSLLQYEIGGEISFDEINPSTTTWWNSFQRHMVLACHFWILCHCDDKNKALIEYRDLAFENLKEMIDDQISDDEPQFAALLDANIDEYLCNGKLPRFFPLQSAFATRRI